jgi:hypothetical protein
MGVVAGSLASTAGQGIDASMQREAMWLVVFIWHSEKDGFRVSRYLGKTLEQARARHRPRLGGAPE